MDFDEAFKDWFVRKYGRNPSSEETASASFGVDWARHRLIDHYAHRDRVGRAA